MLRMPWNLIVPPIIAVVAAVILVVFFRKRARGDRSASARRSLKFSKDSDHASFWGRAIDSAERGVASMLRVFSGWFQKVSASASSRLPKPKEHLRMERKSIFRKKKEAPAEVKPADGIVQRKKRSEEPMLRDRIAKPEKKKEMNLRDAYEETLIERIAEDPRDIGAYESLGDFYLNRKNFEDAQECYRQILKLNPAHRGARVRLERLEKILEQ